MVMQIVQYENENVTTKEEIMFINIKIKLFYCWF